MKSLILSFGCIVATLSGSSSASLYNATSKSKPSVSRVHLDRDFNPQEVFKITTLDRTVSVEKVYAREKWDFTIQNAYGKGSRRDIYVPFDADTMQTLGGCRAHQKGNRNIVYSCEAVAKEAQTDDSPNEHEYLLITLSKPLAPKEEASITLSYQTLSAFTPLPAQIDQMDQQYLQYTLNAYAPSAYPVETQSLAIVFPSSKITDWTDTPNLKASRKGTKITYGPFKATAPLAKEPVSVRYEFTHPLLHATKLERDIEVSHWGGNVAFEERYWLENLGATLKNHYSRVKWAMALYANGPTTALRELNIPLKGGSVDAYFTDDIGNVSTSRFRTDRERAHLTVKPRYPLFGGWKYSFRIGWNGETSKHLRKLASGDGYVLRVPFLEGPVIKEGMEYESVQVRVILPEGSRNIKFSTSVPLVSNTSSLHSSFMDTIGRPAVTLTALNVVDDIRNADLVVTYDYPFGAAYRKPLVVTVALFAVFVVSWALGTLDTSIGKKKVA